MLRRLSQTSCTSPSEASASDSDSEAGKEIQANRFKVAALCVVVALRLRSVSKKHTSAFAKHKIEHLLDEPQKGEELTFQQKVLSAPGLMCKSTGFIGSLVSVRAADEALKLSVKVLHQMKIFTLRICWIDHLVPMKKELSRCKEDNAMLKTRFQETRAAYLKEISALRDTTMKRGDPLAGLDVGTFYGPQHMAASEEELAYLKECCIEMVKMVFSKNPKVEKTIDFGQLQEMQESVKSHVEEALKRELKRAREEITRLQGMQDGQNASAASPAGKFRSVGRRATVTDLVSMKGPDEAKTELADAEKRIQFLEEKLMESRTQVQAVKKELNADLLKAEQRIHELEEELNLQLPLDGSALELNLQFQAEIESQNGHEQGDSARQARLHLRAHSQQINSNAKLRADLESIQVKLDQEKEGNAKLRAELESTKALLDKQIDRTLLDEQIDINVKLKAELDSSKASLNDCQSQLHSSRAELNSLREKLKASMVEPSLQEPFPSFKPFPEELPLEMLKQHLSGIFEAEALEEKAQVEEGFLEYAKSLGLTSKPQLSPTAEIQRLSLELQDIQSRLREKHTEMGNLQSSAKLWSLAQAFITQLREKFCINAKLVLAQLSESSQANKLGQAPTRQRQEAGHSWIALPCENCERLGQELVSTRAHLASMQNASTKLRVLMEESAESNMEHITMLDACHESVTSAAISLVSSKLYKEHAQYGEADPDLVEAVEHLEEAKQQSAARHTHPDESLKTLRSFLGMDTKAPVGKRSPRRRHSALGEASSEVHAVRQTANQWFTVQSLGESAPMPAAEKSPSAPSRSALTTLLLKEPLLPSTTPVAEPPGPTVPRRGQMRTSLTRAMMGRDVAIAPPNIDATIEGSEQVQQTPKRSSIMRVGDYLTPRSSSIRTNRHLLETLETASEPTAPGPSTSFVAMTGAEISGLSREEAHGRPLLPPIHNRAIRRYSSV